MKSQICQMVKDLVNHEYLYFSTSLLIKLTPYTWPVQIWAICIDTKDSIWLMTGHEEWFELEETDRNYSEVLSTLYQRMQSIYKTYKTAV